MFSNEEAIANGCQFGICKLTTGDKANCYKLCSNQRVLAEAGYPHLRSMIQLTTEIKYLNLIPEPAHDQEIKRLKKIRSRLKKNELTDDEALQLIFT